MRLADVDGLPIEAPAFVVGHREHDLPDGVEYRAPFAAGEPFALTEDQARFHASEAFLRIFSAGFNSGKTRALIVETVILAVENPACPVILIAPTHELSRDVHEPELVEVLELCGFVEGRDFVVYGTPKRSIELFGGMRGGGSVILMRSAQKPRILVGTNAAAVLIDEPGQCPQFLELLRNARRRARHKRATRRGVVLCGTPDVGTAFGRLVMNPPADAEIIYGSTDANPYADRTYIAQLEADYTAETIEAYRHGRPVALSQLAYYTFADRAFPDGNLCPWTYDPKRTVVLTVDNNRSPLAAVLLQVGDDGQTLHAFDEVRLKTGTWRALAEIVHAKLDGVAPRGFVIHGDPVLRGQVHDEDTDFGAFVTIREQLADVFAVDASAPGLRFRLAARKSAPMVVDRLEATCRFICNVRGERRLLVDPRCKELLLDLRTNTVDDDGQLVKDDKDRTHWMDPVGYVIADKHPIQADQRGSRRPSFLFRPL